MSDNVAHAVAGAAGGVVSMLCTYPLITISTRAQVTTSSSHPSTSSLLSAVRNILKEEGVTGLYTGLSSALFGITVTNGVYYYWYEMAKGVFQKEGRNATMSTVQSMTAGALAGSATALVTNPIWVVNTRMTANRDAMDSLPSSSKQVQPKKKNAVETFWSIVSEDGPQALFQGIIPALILVVNPIIQYTAFEQIKVRVLQYKEKLNGFDFFLMGAASKLVATSITYPYIVVKSRMQMRQSKSDERTRYRSVMDGFRKILAHEGINGLYKGISSKLLQSVLTAALLFAAKEEFYRYAVWLLVFLRLRINRVRSHV